MADTRAPTASRTLGRPAATTHARIEQIAFELFAERGFEGTTIDDLAEAVGVGRRTLFRYFDSKNDIPWGQFDESLAGFARILRSFDPSTSIAEAVHRSVVAFNTFPDEAIPQHRARMKLILGTPALQAHSTIKYAQWRRTISEFVAERTSRAPDDLYPLMIGHVSLALSISAYEQWLAHPEADLPTLLDQGMDALRAHLAS